ncbi:hypothetical protein [Vibrio diabolicus]|uniref:hypothetical protein n=1 Tax=Vibrio diabolicus TaxID=50719 RepID=UPI00375310D5
MDKEKIYGLVGTGCFQVIGGTPPHGWIEIPSPPEKLPAVLQSNGIWTYPDAVSGREEPAIFAEAENQWVAHEMVYVDRQVTLHEDSDPRSTLTASVWRSYRRALRDYVKDGVVTMAIRPQRPTENSMAIEGRL